MCVRAPRDSMGPGERGPGCIARDMPMRTWLSLCPGRPGLYRWVFDFPLANMEGSEAGAD